MIHPLRPEAALDASLKILKDMPDAGKDDRALTIRQDGYLGYLHAAALSVVASRKDPALWPVLSSSLPKFREHWLELGIERQESPLDENLARCVPVDRLEEVLALCVADPQDRHPHRKEQPVSDLAWGMVPFLDAHVAGDICMRRTADAKIADHERRAAAQVLAALRPRVVGTKDVDTLVDLSRNAANSFYIRWAAFEALPWKDPGPHREKLLSLVRTILGAKGDEERRYFAWVVTKSPDPSVQGAILDAIAADDTLTIQGDSDAFRQKDGTTNPGLTRLIEKRLRSGKPELVGSALVALESLGERGQDTDIGEFLGSSAVMVRTQAAKLAVLHPRDSYRGALRNMAAWEEDGATLGSCVQALIHLKDRQGAEALIAKSFKEGSPQETARIQAAAALGTPEECQALEPRLSRIRPPTLAQDLLVAIARSDREAGKRVVSWGLVQPDPVLRAGAARAIGEGRLAEFLPALRAMAVSDASDVAPVAMKALRRFDRADQMEAYLLALRAVSSESVAELSAGLADLGDAAFAKQLLPLMCGRRSEWAAHWARAMDGCINPEAQRRWSSLTPLAGFMTLAEFASFLEGRGIRVILSDQVRAGADPAKRIKFSNGDTVGSAWPAIGLEIRGTWPQDWVAPVSSGRDLRFMTLGEARAYWQERLRPR
ncbi:MAG TPA: hypothetical protein VKU80_09350 [Planctomycetota bacterium]|nr:hypothetical protein [Planctomycetota bacterium]